MTTSVLALLTVIVGIIIEVRKNGISNLVTMSKEETGSNTKGYIALVVGFIVSFFIVKGIFASIAFFIKSAITGIITFITFLGGLI